MSDPEMIREIKTAVTIPVMAKPKSTTLLKRRFWRLLRSTTSMIAKCLQRLTRRITSTSTTSKRPSFAASKTKGRRFSGLQRKQRRYLQMQEQETYWRQ